MDNAEIAANLEELAQHLEEAGTQPLLVQTYRAVAHTVRWLEQPVQRILAEQGRAGLESLQHVDDRTVDALEDLIDTGHLDLLDEVRADLEPQHTFDQVPGISRVLARAIEMRLGIVTLEELATAAVDGRLERMPEIDPDGVARIQAGLRARMGRRSMRAAEHPPVAELLSIDREYRRRAAAGELHRIAPSHNNPQHIPWLPVLHSIRGPHRYTALFSNTDLAHTLGKTDDWVIIYTFVMGRVRQDMVATELEGDLAARRVVRGREQETREHYQRETVPA